jgi:hypothetical protein
MLLRIGEPAAAEAGRRVVGVGFLARLAGGAGGVWIAIILVHRHAVADGGDNAAQPGALADDTRIGDLIEPQATVAR